MPVYNLQSVNVPVPNSHRTILMLGTSLDTKGGVASVVRVYQSSGLFTKWPVSYLATHSDGSFLKKFSVAFRAWLTFLYMLIRGRDFIVHVHSASRASFWRKSLFILPALWSGRPVIFHLHGAEFVRFYWEECGNSAQRLIRYVLKNSNRIIVLSESWRKSISEITDNTRIEVIENPSVPVVWNDRQACRDEWTILFLGRLGYRKGIFVLLDALVRIHQRYPEIRLVCGGDGEVEKVKDVAKKLGLCESIELLGWVGEVQRTALLAKAAIYVLPSFAEGLPMSILEAMSAGLPVVSTPVGGIPEAITDGKEGFLVAAGDAEALCEAICQLLSDRELRQKMGQCAHDTFNSRFHVDVVLPKLEAIYRHFGVTPTEHY